VDNAVTLAAADLPTGAQPPRQYALGETAVAELRVGPHVFPLELVPDTTPREYYA
jgi:hypothetical protein